MKDRMVLGAKADVAETAALTMADPRATDRIVEAVDWKHDERIAEIYASHSGRSTEEMAVLMSENGGRGRWLSPAEVVSNGLADAIEGGATEGHKSEDVKHTAKRGVEALLRAIGIGKSNTPDVSDDVNYIPHTAVQGTSETSAIAFGEGQDKVVRTRLKEVEDPSLMEMPRDERKRAYESDAKAMRIR